MNQKHETENGSGVLQLRNQQLPTYLDDPLENWINLSLEFQNPYPFSLCSRENEEKKN